MAIVGYTNAGKSQLLKSLTNKEVRIKNELFATLDSRIGKLYLPETENSCLISDTIGFVRDLPPELIDAFHSTLAETVEADLLLHVIDIEDLDMEWKIEVVHHVMKKINCQHKKMIYVFNKIDSMQFDRIKELNASYKNCNPVFVSALKKLNLKELKSEIAKSLSKKRVKA